MKSWWNHDEIAMKLRWNWDWDWYQFWPISILTISNSDEIEIKLISKHGTLLYCPTTERSINRHFEKNRFIGDKYSVYFLLSTGKKIRVIPFFLQSYTYLSIQKRFKTFGIFKSIIYSLENAKENMSFFLSISCEDEETDVYSINVPAVNFGYKDFV